MQGRRLLVSAMRRLLVVDALQATRPLQSSRSLHEGIKGVRELKIDTDEFELILKAQREKDGVPKTPREPFLKGIYMKEFEQNYLEYPELSTEELANTRAFIEPIRECVAERFDSALIDRQKHLPADAVDELRKLESFGGIIPILYGGMNLDNLQYAHLMHAVSHDINLGAQFYIQQSWIAQSLLSYGTEEQKAQWLPGLATGQMKGAFALAEEASGSDHANMTCRATPGRNGSFELRGSKTWVSLAEEADFFLLFCKVPIADGQQDFGAMIDKLPWTKHMPGPQPIPRGIDKTKRTTAFIVPRETPGITIEDTIDSRCLSTLRPCKVSFNCTVGPESLLGAVAKGFTIATDAINRDRHILPIAALPTLKRVLQILTEHMKSINRFHRPAFEFELVRERIFRLAGDIYALESMCYLTAFLVSQTERPNFEMESAACRYQMSCIVPRAIHEVRQALGTYGLNGDIGDELERMYRDTTALCTLDGVGDLAGLFGPIAGFYATGQYYEDVVHKARHPFQFPWTAWRNIFVKGEAMGLRRARRSVFPEDYLHPTLSVAGKYLEEIFIDMCAINNQILNKHAREIFERQMDMQRLNEMGVALYTTTAVLGRASRSYCLGLKNCDHEMDVARWYTFHNAWKVRQIGIEYTPTEGEELDVVDYIAKHAVEDIIDKGGYAISEPIDRNF